MQVETRHFGIFELADGDVVVADGGIHGVPGHRIRISRDGSADWLRQTGSFRPSGPEGTGTLVLDPSELDAVARWISRLSEVYMTETSRPAPARWVFVVARRRGDEVTVVEGGGLTFDDAPEELADLLGWLRARVDAAAGH